MEIINLNLIPTGTRPVVHASQYDNGRQFRANLFEGASVYTLTGAETLTFSVRKPDGHIVTEGVTNTSDNYVVIETTTQMCACAGDSFAELKIENGDDLIGTLNLILAVEQSPEEGGDPSESFIYNLRTQIAEGVAEEVAEQYDSANVIFDNAPTSGHGTPYTVTSEGIKTAIDNAFDYDNTASGSLVHITDGADNVPVKSLESEITAVQSGSGTPSPSNPRAISGFDSGIVSVIGKNLYDFEGWLTSFHIVPTKIGNSYTFDTTGNSVLYSQPFVFSDTDIPITFNAQRSYPAGSTATNVGFDVLKKDGTLVANRVLSFTGNASKIRLNWSNTGTVTITEPQIELGNQATTYEAYNGNDYTFAFGQTVYGGHFDNKGNLVVTHIYRLFDGLDSLGWQYQRAYGSSLRFNYNNSDIKPNSTSIISNMFEYSAVLPDIEGISTHSSSNMIVLEISASRLGGSTVADLMTFFANNNLQVVYELANPITLAITSQDIPTLLECNIFSNCGDVEVNYYTSKSNDILEFVDSEIGKKNGENIPIEEGSPDSIKDYIDNGLSGKADTSDLNDKQDRNVLNIVKHYDTGTSSDAITDIITEYGKVNMVFAFDVPLGYFTGCLTFANDNMGSGFIVLSTTGRFWVVSYVSGAITLTELT